MRMGKQNFEKLLQCFVWKMLDFLLSNLSFLSVSDHTPRSTCLIFGCFVLFFPGSRIWVALLKVVNVVTFLVPGNFHMG